MKWTTPEEIAEHVLKRWNRGEILSAHLSGETLFPLELRLKRPSPREVADCFGEVMDWARRLSEASREKQEFGFELRRETFRNQVQGSNELPAVAIVPTMSDAVRMIRQQTEMKRFEALAETTQNDLPALLPWLVRRPLIALEHGAHWNRVLAVLKWFSANPRPGLYLRQLDIPYVDTKFIEEHRELLAELLDAVLPEDAVDRTAAGARGFLQRYGLRADPPLVRFRLLDRKLYLHGLSDLSLPPEQFGALQLNVGQIFITENRTNGLAFPDCADSMVIFGLGYGLARLSEISWMRDVYVYYWGDIDTHGFGILDRLRATLPAVQSFLMDRETLKAHRILWGQEPPDKRYIREPQRLTPAEYLLFDDLRRNRLGDCVRLEQERIGYGWLERALTTLNSTELL